MVDTGYYKVRREPPPPPPGCPIDHDFSPFDPEYQKNPYAILKNYRRDKPVFYSDKMNCLVLTRMADIAEIFLNSNVFSSENVQHPVTPICDAAREVLAVEDYDPLPVLSNGQPPNHTRVRKYAHAGFSPRRMKILEPYIRRRVETLIDEMVAKGSPADFVEAVESSLSGETIYRFVGFPEEDDLTIKNWSANRLAFTWGKSSEDEQVLIAENMLAYWRYCAAFVDKRLTEPADDFTSELLEVHKSNPEELQVREIVSIIYGLSFAGYEIVINLMSNCLINLLSNRNYWENICKDPALIPDAITEVIRYDSPQTGWRRLALEDTEIAGYKVPAGTELFLSLASANHDEDVFEKPEVIDIFRKNARAHISFGKGIHFCLGNRLATLQAKIVLETLAERLPELNLTENQNFSFYPNITLRGPDELWLAW